MKKLIYLIIVSFCMFSFFTSCKSDTYILEGITIDGDVKTEYAVGCDLIKPIVIAHYSNKTSKDVTDKCIFTEYDLSTIGDSKVNITYTENNVTKNIEYSISITKAKTALKFAVFADVQLTGEYEVNGESVVNLGATANAANALRSHFQFIKDNNINVVLMNGDICNQANEYYYQYFEKILKEVFGEDETTYPEFVYNMGNHEWWWGITEKETGDAVTLFKKYARIESPNLVKMSTMPYGINPSQQLPSYYKVINGVPIMVISGQDSSGNIGKSYQAELASWIEEIKQLESVKAGGPIFVLYHEPISSSMTFGQGSLYASKAIDELFKDTPNAVVFTGDTHFPGVNERAINQVNFTTINLGTSSYSRMVDRSAVVCKDYYNVGGSTGSAKSGQMLLGNAKYEEAYTPTIQVVDVLNNNEFTIDRYFTDVQNGRKVGEQWQIGRIKSKDDFKYTNERFENRDAAKALYGAEGLSWNETDEVLFGVNEKDKQITVQFMDVINYHFCEHYKIEVNDQVYDCVSMYYCYPESRVYNSYVLEGITLSDTYTVKVTAYDFFDNPSLNFLLSTTSNDKYNIDPQDNAATKTYCDIYSRIEFQDVATEDSHSSIEYHYKGYYPYKYGAILTHIYNYNSTGINQYLSIGKENCHPFLQMYAKNLGEGDLVLGLSVITFKNGSMEEWRDDFSSTTKTIKGNKWTYVCWDLYESFGIKNINDISRIVLKGKTTIGGNGLYDMDFLIDGIDILSDKPEDAEELHYFDNEKDVYLQIPTQSITDVLTIDVKFDNTDEANRINVSLFVTNWGDFLGSFDIDYNGLKGSYTGVSSVKLDNGYVRVIFNLDQITRIKNVNEQTNSYSEINYVYIRGNYSHGDGNFKINSNVGKIVE